MSVFYPFVTLALAFWHSEKHFCTSVLGIEAHVCILSIVVAFLQGFEMMLRVSHGIVP